jgi:hypothetical protein
MNFLKLIARLLRRGFLWLFLAYWMMFIGYTVTNFVVGGSSEVVRWYEHIDRNSLQWNWSWKRFLARQLLILAITLTLWFFARRSARRRLDQLKGEGRRL